MKTIKLKSYKLKNFKNFADLSFDFEQGEKITTLLGKSGSGKSTAMNAWFFVCGLEVDSPYPKLDNKIIEDLETSVEFDIYVGDMEIEYKISRSAKQKWKIDKENNTKEFNGFDSSIYNFDGFPTNATNYKEKIAQLFGVEKHENIKFLCQTSFFNKNNLQTWNWKNRREVLYKICDVDTALLEIANKEEFSLISNELKKKSTTDFKKQLDADKKAINENKNKNEILLKEKKLELSNYEAYDFEKLDKQAKKLEKDIEIEKNIAEVGNERIQEIEFKKKISEIANKISEFETSDNTTKFKLNSDLQQITNIVENKKIRLISMESELNRNLSEYKKINESEWKGDTTCVSCGQTLLEMSISHEKEKWNIDKQNKLTTLVGFIKSHKIEIDKEKEVYTSGLSQIDIIKLKISNLKPSEEIEKLQKEKSKFNKKLEDIGNGKIENTKLLDFQSKLTTIKEQLSFRQVKDNIEKRVELLKNEVQDLTQKEIKNSKQRKCLEKYNIEIISVVNNIVNDKFQDITWNLFNTTTASAENQIVEDCEAMYDGKLFSSQLSDGEKLIANFNTTIALQKAFDVCLPIFFDNYSASSFELNCEQQLVLNYTLPADKELRKEIIKIYKNRGVIFNKEENNLLGTRINKNKGE